MYKLCKSDTGEPCIWDSIQGRIVMTGDDDYMRKTAEKIGAEPDADMLFKLCDLYGISDIGIFYGRTSKPNITDICSVSRSDLSASESELLTLYRSVSEVGQEHILSTARLVAGNPGMKKDALPHAR